FDQAHIPLEKEADAACRIWLTLNRDRIEVGHVGFGGARNIVEGNGLVRLDIGDATDRPELRRCRWRQTGDRGESGASVSKCDSASEFDYLRREILRQSRAPH